MNIEELKARLAELNEKGKAVQAKADAEKRELTAEEQTEIDDLFAEFEQTEANIARREKMAAQEATLTASAGRVTTPAKPNADPRNDAPTERKPGPANSRLLTQQDRAQWGFKSMGDFCAAVLGAARNPSAVDQRLVQNAAASTYGSEGVGADGGFSVPPEWRSEIMQMVAGEDSILSRTDQQICAGNSITFPVDETTSWQSTGGIQAYWDSEAATIAQSKPLLKDLTAKLSRITCLVPMTDELLEDSASMGAYVPKKAAQKIDFKITDAIVNGTGVGQPLGILNAPCLVTVNKVSSQTGSTFHADNVAAMMARMPAGSFGKSVWLINQDVLPQIFKLGFVVTSASSTTGVGAGALYLPPNGLSNSPAYGTLLGRPIIVTEACATLGTAGDVILADLSQYLSVVKTGGLKSDVSIHLWFDQNLTAFRFVMRMNGQPWLSTAIARKNGSNTLSHFVALQAR